MVKTESVEELIRLRDSLLQAIVNLEFGLLAEKKKADEFEFYKNDKNFDSSAMLIQIERCKDNITSITKVLQDEKEKLNVINKKLDDNKKVIDFHKSHLCLIGSVPHSWQVLSKHPSGQFSHRKCNICNTVEKVGYV